MHWLESVFYRLEPARATATRPLSSLVLTLRMSNAIVKTRQDTYWGVEMNYGRELLKGNTDSLLLCLISRQPTYGYQIVKELEKRSNGYFQFKEGTLYPALHRLERDNLITGKWQILPNGQQRRYYYITENGQQVLAKRLATWQDFSSAVKAVIQAETT